MIEQNQFIVIDFDLLRIILASSMLIIATFFDLKKREVHDIIWAGFGASAVVLLLLEIDNYSMLILTALSLSMLVPAALILWRIGIFGGADSFAIIVLSGLAPFATLTENQVTPFTVLINASLLSLVILFANGLKNSLALVSNEDIFKGFNESKKRKALAFFIGTRAKSPKYSFSIEKTSNDSKKLDFSFINAENSEFCKTPNTWVTPGMPFILYITLGFIVQIFFGDLLFSSLDTLSLYSFVSN